MGKHFILAPSGAYRWGICPGSLVYDYEVFKKGGSVSSPEALEGTFAHEISRICLVHGLDVNEGMKGSIDANGVAETRAVDYDMCGFVSQYLKYCRSLPGDLIFIEQKLDLDSVYGLSVTDKKVLVSLGLSPDAGGTADYIVFDVMSGVLHVVDLKYGRGVEVFAEGNGQGSIYCSGAVEMIENTFGVEVQKINFVIFQPRMKSEPDVWEFDRSLINDIDCEVQLSVENAIAVLSCIANKEPVNSSFFNVDEKACLFCPGAKGDGTGICPHRSAYLETSLDIEFDNAISVEKAIERVPDLTNEEIGYRLPVLDMVTKYISSLWSEAHARQSAGSRIPGQKLVAGKKGNRKWDDEEFIATELRRMKFKDDEAFDKKVKSPAKIEKICSKKGSKIKWKKLQKHITQSEASLTLVPESDPREDMTPIAIEEEFKDVEVLDNMETQTNNEENINSSLDDEMDKLING